MPGGQNNFKREMFALAHSCGNLSPRSALSIAFASVVRHNVMEGVQKGKNCLPWVGQKVWGGRRGVGGGKSLFPLLGHTPSDVTSSERP